MSDRQHAANFTAPELIDSRQAAQLMDCSTPTARRWLRRHCGPSVAGLRPEKWPRRLVLERLGLPPEHQPAQSDWQ